MKNKKQQAEKALEGTVCPVCGGKGIPSTFEKNYWGWVSCLGCGSHIPVHRWMASQKKLEEATPTEKPESPYPQKCYDGNDPRIIVTQEFVDRNKLSINRD